MKLNKIFNVEICKNPISMEFAYENPGNIPYVTTTSFNNGVETFVDYPAQYEGGKITVSKDGGSADAFLQEYPFCGNEKVMVLSPKVEMTKKELLFYCYLINKNKYKFAYGRKCSVERINELDLIEIKDFPNRVNKVNIIPITTKNKKINFNLDTNTRKEFSLDKLFLLKGGFYNKKPEHSIEGNFPFLASTESNNGVTEYYSLDDIETWDKVGNQDNTLNKKIYEGNCIAVTVNGSVCNAFYQNREFTCSHDITALYLKGHTLNQYIALFLCSVIMKEKYRWSYGRKPHDVKKFGKSIIKLPIDNSGNPDREFMENYIKNLPYGDRI